jgi:hypothetical protein
MPRAVAPVFSARNGHWFVGFFDVSVSSYSREDRGYAKGILLAPGPSYRILRYWSGIVIRAVDLMLQQQLFLCI